MDEIEVKRCSIPGWEHVEEVYSVSVHTGQVKPIELKPCTPDVPTFIIYHINSSFSCVCSYIHYHIVLFQRQEVAHLQLDLGNNAHLDKSGMLIGKHALLYSKE